MKKITTFFMSLLLLLLLVSCKGETAPTNENSSTDIDESSVVSYPIYEVTSPIYTDLTLEHFKKLYVGMPFEEALKILGAPHKSVDYQTSPLKIHFYTAFDGKEYQIEYENGAIKCVIYPVSYKNLTKKTNLTMEDINKIYIGMPFEEAIEILGEPHRTIGFGFIRDVYKLTDGTEWCIMYLFGAVDRMDVFSTE